MADIKNILGTVGNSLGSAVDFIGAGIGAYNSAPKAASVNPYMDKLRSSMASFQPTDIDGLKAQLDNIPVTHNINAETLYDPSMAEQFTSALGAGLGMMGASNGITSMANGKLGTSTIGRKSANGGNLFLGGGPIDLDNGAMLSAGLDILSGGLGVALNFAGQAAQKSQAEDAAKLHNATKSYIDAYNAHNAQIALDDTKNNTFNAQALRMMANGGILQDEFPMNGDFNVIGSGGTHEQNVHGGVQQGYAPDGAPNYVEEDEVVWNNYVFSQRLKVPESFCKEHKLPEGISYAEAAQKLTQEAKERPNDPISKNGMEDILTQLKGSQEDIRAKKRLKDFKKDLKSMTPEEVLNIGAALQANQGSINPEELSGMMAACGGQLKKGAHTFNGTSNEKTNTMEKELDYNTLLSLAGVLDPTHKNAELFTEDENGKKNLRKFILENLGIEESTDSVDMLPTLLRKAPVLGSLITTLSSMSEKPKDYSTNVTPYTPTYKPIGDFVGYTPVDSQRYLLSRNRQAAAQRNAIANQSGANRNMAMAQMALANSQGQEDMASLLNTIETINYARDLKRGEFNRGTNQTNAAAFNALQPLFAQRDATILNQQQRNAATRMAVDQALDEALGANLTNLFDNLATIGNTNLAYNMANSRKDLSVGINKNGSFSYKGR